METETRTPQAVTRQWASKHPILLGLIWITVCVAFVALMMKAQGWPVSALVPSDARPAARLIGALAFAALFFGYAMKFWIDRVHPWVRRKPVVAVPLIILVVGIVVFGDRVAAALFPMRWIVIERTGGTALFLDTASVHKSQDKVTFWTKLDHSNWVKRALRATEIRARSEIDCTQQTMRDIEGGVFQRGHLKYPAEQQSAGRIPAKGYARQLYVEVC